MDIDKELTQIYNKLHHKKIAIFAILGFLALLTYLLIVVNSQVASDQAMITQSEASSVVSGNGNGDGQSGAGSAASGGDVSMGLGRPLSSSRRACYGSNNYFTADLYQFYLGYGCKYQCFDVNGNITRSGLEEFVDSVIPVDQSPHQYCESVAYKNCNCVAPTSTPTPVPPNNSTPTPIPVDPVCIGCNAHPHWGNSVVLNPRDVCMDAIKLGLNCVWKYGECQNGKLDPTKPTEPQIKLCYKDRKTFCSSDLLRTSRTNCMRYSSNGTLCYWDAKKGCTSY